MYRFLNYSSHEFGDVDSMDEPLLSEAGDKIVEFFDIIKLIDSHHYEKIRDHTIFRWKIKNIIRIRHLLDTDETSYPAHP